MNRLNTIFRRSLQQKHLIKKLIGTSHQSSVCWLAKCRVIKRVLSLFQQGFHRVRSKRSQKEFSQNFPSFLLSLGTAIRCGQDPLQAMLLLKDIFPKNSYFAVELEKLDLNLRQSVREDAAIKKFADNQESTDLLMFKECFLLSRFYGGNLSDSLLRITQSVRQRQSFQRKVAAAIAMQKLAAFGILLAIIFILILQIIVNRELLLNAWSDSFGRLAILMSVALTLTGMIWMLLIGRRFK